MENLTLKKESIGVYEIELLQRINPSIYPLHGYGVKLIKNTPKGKYSKFKVIENFVYKTLEDAEKKFDSNFKAYAGYITRRAEEKEYLKQKNLNVKASDHYSIGDIIINSWGYEQTNIDFYQVVAMTNKTIEIKEIGQEIVKDSMYGHGMACEVVAVKDSFTENGDTYKLRVKAGGTLSNPANYYYMHKWSGNPSYKSWYA